MTNHAFANLYRTVTAVFMGTVCLMAVVHATESKNETEETGLKNVPFVMLNNGMKMPQLGFGTWTLQGDVAVVSVKTALQKGYRRIDSAQAYGNEADVYQGIVASGVPRNEVFITTKIAPNVIRDGTVRQSLDKSLAAFGNDYIDLVLIHWPVKGKVEETWKVMEEYVNNGKFRAIGMSNFNPHHMDDLLKYATIKPVINQIEIHPYMSQQEVVGYTLNKEGIRVECWSPLGSGKNGVLQDETLVRLAKKNNKSVAQIILRWDIQRGLLVIPRSDNPEHIAENIEIFNFELSPVDMSVINGLNRNKRVNSKNDPDNFPW